MIYEVYLDGEQIYDTNYKELSLVNPKVNTEVNTAGSCEFTVPAFHLFFGEFAFKKTIEVFENGELIFTGRPSEQKAAFNNSKTVYCEGALAYFNDSVYPFNYGEFDTTTVKGYLQALLDNHNSQVDENRRIYLGNVTCKPDRQIYRQPKYEKTLDLMQKGLLDAEGGYFFIRKQDGLLYLDYLSKMPYTCNQTIEFGKNLLDYSANFTAEDIVTRLIPLGADMDAGQDENGNTIRSPLTIESINGTIWVQDDDLVAKYGIVTKTIRYEGVTDPAALLKNARSYLKYVQWDALSIEATAAELHNLNPEMEKFKVGQIVRVSSKPHGLDRNFALVKIDLNLASGTKKITLGTQKRKNLTEIYKQETEKTADDWGSGDIGDFDDIPTGDEGDFNIPDIDDPDINLDDGLGDDSVDLGDFDDDFGLSDDFGNDYLPTIDFDETTTEETIPDGDDVKEGTETKANDDGSTTTTTTKKNGDGTATKTTTTKEPHVTLKKVPKRIAFAKDPKTSYEENDTVDWSEAQVIAEYSDGASKDITSECTYTPAQGFAVKNISGNTFKMMAGWKFQINKKKSKLFSCSVVAGIQRGDMYGTHYFYSVNGLIQRVWFSKSGYDVDNGATLTFTESLIAHGDAGFYIYKPWIVGFKQQDRSYHFIVVSKSPIKVERVRSYISSSGGYGGRVGTDYVGTYTVKTFDMHKETTSNGNVGYAALCDLSSDTGVFTHLVSYNDAIVYAHVEDPPSSITVDTRAVGAWIDAHS